MAYTPEQAIKNLRPAFLDLFEKPNPDIARFLRLVILVLDPDPGYKAACTHCSYKGLFPVETNKDGAPFGCACPQCGYVYHWASYDFKYKNPSVIMLTSTGTSKIGDCQSLSDSGVEVKA